MHKAAEKRLIAGAVSHTSAAGSRNYAFLCTTFPLTLILWGVEAQRWLCKVAHN